MPYAIVAVLILLIDQTVKYWTITSLALNETKSFIPGLLDLTYIQNYGAAFGILQGQRWFFVVLTVVFVAAVIYLLSKDIIKGRLGRWMLVLVMAGGVGNCIDRVMNRYVVDMFSFHFMDFAIFNVADIFVTLGGIIFCVYLIFHREPKTDSAEDALEKVPNRPLPVASERPVKSADYISQLKNPVVQGRKNIEAEIEAKRAEMEARRAEAEAKRSGASQIKQPEVSFTEWSEAELDAAQKQAPSPASPKEATPEPAARSAFEPRLDTAVRPAAVKAEPAEQTPGTPASSPKKSDTDFSLEDILAEFKD